MRNSPKQTNRQANEQTKNQNQKRRGMGEGIENNCEIQRTRQKMWSLTNRNSRKREQRKIEEGKIKEIFDVISQNWRIRTLKIERTHQISSTSSTINEKKTYITHIIMQFQKSEIKRGNKKPTQNNLHRKNRKQANKIKTSQI